MSYGNRWLRLAAAALLALCALSVRAETVELRISHFLGARSFFQVDLVEPWARELERRTGGQVRVDVLDGSSPLGNVRNQATQVKDGVVDIALGLRGAEGDRFLRSSIIELPFVVADAGSGSRALWGLFKRGVIADEYRDFKVLALFVHNPGLIHTKATPVRELTDLKGLRLRVPNATVAKALEHVGAQPRLLQPDEIVAALRANQLDGIVTNWGTPIAGFNDETTWHTAVPFYASAFFIVMNKQRYEGLPADIRQAIDSLAGDALVERFGPLWDQWDKPLHDGAIALGRTILRPDADSQKRWKTGLQPMSDAYVKMLESKGFGDARRVYEQLLTRSAGP